MNKLTDKAGFTLVETLVAVIILTIAVFAMYALQTTAIRGNATANSLSTASNWTRDRIEKLLAKDYYHPDLEDGDGANDGRAGLNDWPNSDGRDETDDIYKIYWNIATDGTLTNIVDKKLSPKHIRVIVTREKIGFQK